MNSLKYFYINNQKFNYTLEFQSNHVNDYWKYNAPLIEYCETLGVTIPHYCYHKNLSISGNCRMCLVELKNSPKPIVSCALSAKSCLNNNEVFTNSPLVKKARENILEFLLLNHPLDCPICDQGGECDLQDQSLYFGITKKRFYTFKRIVTDKNIGPIVKTVMTRCIHCTRCVRFADEIAGTEDLGMFGRGLDSEVGTYVTKTFQSELSGNVIDLCPVGALTSKPYPFLSRSWELKTIDAIDFSDGFCSNLQISLKNNQIIKVTSNYNSNLKTTPWISDKTRFSFDGMFSPERILKGFIKTNTNTNTMFNWKLLLTEIVTTLYFQDHLIKHFSKTHNLYIIFSNNISLEVLQLLVLLSKKYSFIKLRKFENSNNNNDLETDFTSKLNTINTLTKNINNSNLCLTLGLNSRYESSRLNIHLRKRYLKGNFKIFSIGSNNDLTFSTQNIGLNLNILNSIITGNNVLCQEFITAKNPSIIISSSIFKRKDIEGLNTYLKYFKSFLTKYHSNWENFNIINSSVNETGSNYLMNFKTISEKDLNNLSGFYFLDTQNNSLNFKKLIKIKLLKFFNNNLWPNYCFEQNFGNVSNFSKHLQSNFKIYNYINLPNNSFFESTGTFLNTEGEFKNNIKFITTKSQTKEDWQIIRKIFFNVNNINFITKNNNKLTFNNKTFIKFKYFATFLYQASINISNNKNIFLNNKISELKFIPLIRFKASKSKIFNTKLKIWINDFYLGGNDSYSQYSKTMINCSKILRLEKNNFSHLI